MEFRRIIADQHGEIYECIRTVPEAGRWGALVVGRAWVPNETSAFLPTLSLDSAFTLSLREIREVEQFLTTQTKILSGEEV